MIFTLLYRILKLIVMCQVFYILYGIDLLLYLFYLVWHLPFSGLPPYLPSSVSHIFLHIFSDPLAANISLLGSIQSLSLRIRVLPSYIALWAPPL